MAARSTRRRRHRAGRWANWAHLPGWARDERCQIVGVCDVDPQRAAEAAQKYGAVATQDYRELLQRDDIDVIDVVTRDSEHFEINVAAIEAGKHVLSEKPVAHDYRDVRRAADLARSRGLKTKVGLTFRYSPAVRYLKDLVARGDLGTPYIYNAYEQNSQWLNPQTPLRSSERAHDGPIKVASLEGYGAPVIDIGHWLMDSDLTSVVGILRNFVPERMIADTGLMTRTNIDDGDIFIGEFASGAICSVQTSFVTVGNYPGYRGAGLRLARARPSPGWSRSSASARPSRWPGPTTWSSAMSRYRPATTRRAAAHGSPGARCTTRTSPLTSPREILGDDEANEGNFDDGLWVQEIVNAVEISHRERRWVTLPLDTAAS